MKRGGGWASTQAAYRLFYNGKASRESIREPHGAATVRRMAPWGGCAGRAGQRIFQLWAASKDPALLR